MQAKEVKPEAVAGGSSYENLYRMASSSDESDDPFSTDHVRLHDVSTEYIVHIYPVKASKLVRAV